MRKLDHSNAGFSHDNCWIRGCPLHDLSKLSETAMESRIKFRFKPAMSSSPGPSPDAKVLMAQTISKQMQIVTKRCL